MTDPRVAAVFDKLTEICRRLLGKTLVGIYVHGSLALGGFTWTGSDIDVLIVVSAEPPFDVRRELIRCFLDLETICPRKGLELSIVLEGDCREIRQAVPYCLHYSGAWRQAYLRDLDGTLRELCGEDPDLPAHFAVINRACIRLSGKEPAEVFAEVPPELYRESILFDVGNAAEDIFAQPVYVTLNLCRAVAFVRDGLILSKQDGAGWALRHLPEKFAPLICHAADCYRNGSDFSVDSFRDQFADFAQTCLSLL